MDLSTLVKVSTHTEVTRLMCWQAVVTPPSKTILHFM